MTWIWSRDKSKLVALHMANAIEVIPYGKGWAVRALFDGDDGHILAVFLEKEQAEEMMRSLAEKLEAGSVDSGGIVR